MFPLPLSDFNSLACQHVLENLKINVFNFEPSQIILKKTTTCIRSEKFNDFCKNVTDASEHIAVWCTKLFRKKGTTMKDLLGSMFLAPIVQQLACRQRQTSEKW